VKSWLKLRVAGSLTGRALMVLGMFLLGAELMRALERGAHTRIALGEFWYLADPGSLNGLQAGVQRYLDPELWETLFAPVLFWPAWAVFLVPGLVLAFLNRPQQPTKMWL
jgi:hypothetical protein